MQLHGVRARVAPNSTVLGLISWARGRVRARAFAEMRAFSLECAGKAGRKGRKISAEFGARGVWQRGKQYGFSIRDHD